VVRGRTEVGQVLLGKLSLTPFEPSRDKRPLRKATALARAEIDKLDNSGREPPA
jgi:hypothetical protein